MGPGACTINLFTVVINSKSQVIVFVTVSHFNPSQIFAGKVKLIRGLLSVGRLLALPVNIRLVWKSFSLTNALAYNLIILKLLLNLSPQSPPP